MHEFNVWNAGGECLLSLSGHRGTRINDVASSENHILTERLGLRKLCNKTIVYDHSIGDQIVADLLF